MIAITGETNALSAWKAGAAEILKHTELFNLVTTIDDPVMLDRSWLDAYSPKSVAADMHKTSEVVTTIFPYRIWSRLSCRADLYEAYLERHDRATRMRGRNRSGWGTYFERLIRFGDTRINQVEQLIGALNSWNVNYKAALVMHLSSSEVDQVRKPMRNPCLQFIEVTCPTPTTIGMVAVYRNHDFFERVLGNFIGLGQLLGFIAEATHRKPTTLVCHSIHAYSQKPKYLLRKLTGI